MKTKMLWNETGTMMKPLHFVELNKKKKECKTFHLEMKKCSKVRIEVPRSVMMTALTWQSKTTASTVQ